MKDLTFKKVREFAEEETAMEQLDKSHSMKFCQEGIIDTVMSYSMAGARTLEDVVSEGKPVLLKHEVSRILKITDVGRRILSANTEYELYASNEIMLPKGKYLIEYMAFPEFGGLIEDSPIPLPKMFQTAIGWYLAAKWHAREEGETDTRTQYFAQSYNSACIAAERFYASQNRRRRMPARRIG